MAARTPRLRKPNAKLTQADFKAFPLWEYVDDDGGEEGQDETWVRPLKRASIPRGRYASVFVAADFVLASGRRLTGFAEVDTLEGFALLEAVALYRRQFGDILTRQEPSANYDPRSSLLKLLAMGEQEVFPVQYTLRVPVQGEREPRRGKIA